MQTYDVQGIDVGINDLEPLNRRDINFKTNAGFRKLMASMKRVGMIEPLSIYREGDKYVILDGYLRFKACSIIGVESLPCILYPTKQAYVFNRNVNKLSSFQEMKMLRKATETISEEELASAFGMKTIRYRLSSTLIKELHSKVVKAFKDDIIQKPACLELIYTSKNRQIEILKEMDSMGDYSTSFCRSLVIKTPPEHMNPKKKKNIRKTWKEDSQRKKNMVTRLEQAEKQQQFYSNLYRQYSQDLMKMVIYARKLLSNPTISAHLREAHPEAHETFTAIINEG